MDSYVGRERIDDVALRRYVQKMKNVVFYVAFVLDVLRSSVYVYVSLERGGLHCLDCPWSVLVVTRNLIRDTRAHPQLSLSFREG
jgi:hypothetical protein